MRTISALTVALLSSTTLVVAPAKADATLEELKARLERAQKENLILKTEKIEKENLTIKAEALEAENSAMRNESKASKPTVAGLPKFEPVKPQNNEQSRIAAKQLQDNESSRPREHSEKFKAVDKAIASIPKNDERRELLAVSKAAFDPSPVDQWEGIYAGINAGYGYNDAINTVSNGYGNTSGTANNSGNISNISGTTLAGSSGTITATGAVVGGQVGYNHKFKNNVVMGIEADMDYADVKSSSQSSSNYSISNTNYAGTNNINGIYNNSYNRIGLDWIGTIRGRLGYAAGKFLPYVTGGLAYGGLSNSSNSGFGYGYGGGSSQNVYASNGSGSSTSVRAGWALGAGAEYMLADNWSVKGEYLYTSIGSLVTPTIANNGYAYGYTNNASVQNTALVSKTTISDFGVHQGRLGVNYHTDWLTSKPAVVAKY
jgi:outer membrane immunogenic protein